MKAFVAVLASAAAASAGVIPAVPAPVIPGSVLVRAPQHDSASIENHRLGGNFAYATAEAHAFAKVDPIVASRTVPVAETTHIHTPAAIRTIQPGAITTTHHVAEPVLKTEPIFRAEPVIGPVATHTTYEQPIYKTRTLTHTAAQVHTVAAPAVAVGAVAAPAVAAAPAVTYAGHGLVGGVAAAPAVVGGYAAAPALAGAYGLAGGYGLAGHGVIAAAPAAVAVEH